MVKPSCYLDFILGKLPARLIIDVNDISPDFLEKIKPISDVLEEDRLIELIMESIGYEKDAELELSYRITNELIQVMGAALSEEAVNAANAIVKFGSALYAHLRYLRIYRRGQLLYNFDNWLGGDIVFNKFSFETGAEDGA